MYHEPNNVPAQARTISLNEELGQVGHIFSDKTGILTQNIITFNKCSLRRKLYGYVTDQAGNEIQYPEYSSLKSHKQHYYKNSSDALQCDVKTIVFIFPSPSSTLLHHRCLSDGQSRYLYKIPPTDYESAQTVNSKDDYLSKDEPDFRQTSMNVAQATDPLLLSLNNES
ncbi:unnamed protein product [Rotaria magnacalcarata]